MAVWSDEAMYDGEVPPEVWLHGRAPKGKLSAASRSILNYIVMNLGTAGYAKASEVASATGVSVSSVTRFAQQFGFTGWPDLQRNLRARYLSGLSMLDVSEFHGVTDTPFLSALRQDAAALAQATRDMDEGAIRNVAEILQQAERIYVTAMGSFAGVGQAFTHNLQLAGFPSQALMDREVLLTNTVITMGPTDVLVVCSYWRHYRVIVGAAIAAHRRGAKVIVISDYLPEALVPVACESILIPAEGTSFFASLTVPMAVQQGIVATLARIDSERVKQQIEASERLWDELGILINPIGGAEASLRADAVTSSMGQEPEHD